MATRRFRRPYRSGKSRTRSLEWGAIIVPTDALVAGTSEHVVVLDAQSIAANIHQTIYRIVGSLSFHANVVNVTTTFHYGVYVSNEVSGAAGLRLNPALVSDAAVDQWLWWGARRVVQQDQAAASPHPIGIDDAAYIPFDIKVKRIISSNQQIVFGVNSDQAASYSLNLRELSKITGT